MASWFINDHDEITIYITDDVREFFVPKFRIFMAVEEPYLYLHWNDREQGDGGDERMIQIDYQDVVSGYGGYLSGASSAAQLKESLEAMIVSAWTDIYEVIDSIIVGGSSVTELTPELFADDNITGTGANQFLDDLGYDDTSAGETWPLTAANYPGGLTAADFTLDTVAWQEMFYYAEANGAAYMTTQINYATNDVNKTYYVNKTLYLPRTQEVASNRQSLTFQIDFKGSRVRNSSGGDMILFDRYPVDQDDADDLVGYQFCFWNGVLRGNGGTDENDTLIRIGASSRCEFKNMNMEHAGVMTDLQFCLEPIFHNINVSDYGYWGLAIRNGQWSGAGFFNAQSNIASITNFRSYNAPGGTPNAAIYCDGNHTIEGNHLTFEGDVGSEHHFFYNNDGSAGTNICNLRNIYIEFAGCTRAAIRFRAGKGQFIVSEFRSSVVATDMPVLIEGDNDRSPTASLYIILKNSASGTLNSKLRAVGDPNYPVEWYVDKVRMPDNTQLNVAANFDTGTITNSYIPDDDHVQFHSTDGQGSGIFVDGTTITGQGIESDPFVAVAATSAPPLASSTETSDFTLDISHYWSVIECDTTTTIEVTVPPNSSVAFPIGTMIKLVTADTGVVEVIEGLGVTVNSLDNLLGIASPFGAAWLTKTATDTWYLDGDLVLAYDPDAKLYIDANGTLTEDQAILWNDFVLTGKADGWWSKARALYPLIGGTAATHKWNAVNPVDTDAGFRLAYTNTPTHSANGISFNGTTQYANTFITPTTHLTQDNTTLYFSRRNNTNAGVEIGSEAPASSGFLLAARQVGNYYGIMYTFPGGTLTAASANSTGRWGVTRTTNIVQKLFKDGAQQGATNTNASAGWSNLNYALYIGATNSTGATANYCQCDLDFVGVLDGLTDGEYASFDAAVLTLNTGLGR